MRKIDEKSNEESCFNRGLPNEMLFVLLGRDTAAPYTIREWAKHRVRHGKNDINDPQILEALECADIMEREQVGPNTRLGDLFTNDPFNSSLQQTGRTAKQASLAGMLLQTICHEASRSAGWWFSDMMNHIQVINDPNNPVEKNWGKALVAQKLMLAVSEISEAMEGHRKNLMDDHLPHRKMVEVELADAIIRLFDLGGALNLNVGAAIAEKLAYNAKRADHKPENRAKDGGKAY